MNLESPEINRASLLIEVSNFYQKEINSKDIIEFLTSKNLLNWEVLKRLEFGYSTGSLPKALSQSQKKELQDFGVLDSKGKEVLKNCLIVPLKDLNGTITGFVGIYISEKDPIEKVIHSNAVGYLHQEILSIYNEEILLTSNLLDTLAAINLGYQNTFPIIGGFNEKYIQILKENRVRKVILGFAKDIEEIKKALTNEGISVVVLSKMDSWSFSYLNSIGANKTTIDELIREGIEFEGKIKPDFSISQQKDKWIVTSGQRKYKVQGIKLDFSTSLRVSVKIEHLEKRYFDSLDLLSSRSRNNFKENASNATNIDAVIIENDLLRILEAIEVEQEKNTGQVEDPVDTPLTESEKEIGLTFLKNLDLLDELSSDLEILGYVGEETNKKIAYIASVSRKLENPISILMVASSGSGKSALIDAIRKITPDQEVINLTTLSSQSLNYLPEDGLLNKLLILGEAIHNDSIEYQIREILSSKQINRLTVEKNEKTGKPESVIKTTRAIVSLMMSSTSHNLNPENVSRLFVLKTDESIEQTKKIHEYQNKRNTFEFVLSNKTRTQEIIKKHQIAQRLLKPLLIINPFNSVWEIPAFIMRSRRDNQALNNFILAIAYLRQYQKEIKEFEGKKYIEVDQTDIDIGLKLFKGGIIKSTYLNYPESMILLYDVIRNYCTLKSSGLNLDVLNICFSANELRKEIKFIGIESIQKYLRKLVQLEFLQIEGERRTGKTMKYKLVQNKSFEEIEGMIDLVQKVPATNANVQKIKNETLRT